MHQLSSAQIRQMWLDFWKSKGHAVEPSANLVPVNDPTLLWINSGVATLKKYFDGSVIPDNPRITNAQKSIRTNDIENVGKTARHHTMFEMLGNFSIGDYFRDEAIEWGFELLTSPEWFGFPKEKLYMTYYPDDKDSYNRWISLGVEPSHLIPLEDNFWEIGAGPSGPDTEIFFDRGTEFDPENIGVRLLEEDIEKLNNNVDNLVIMKLDEHTRYHALLREINKNKITEDKLLIFYLICQKYRLNSTN